jgi:hypothetical protein
MAGTPNECHWGERHSIKVVEKRPPYRARRSDAHIGACEKCCKCEILTQGQEQSSQSGKFG